MKERINTGIRKENKVANREIKRTHKRSELEEHFNKHEPRELFNKVRYSKKFKPKTQTIKFKEG